MTEYMTHHDVANQFGVTTITVLRVDAAYEVRAITRYHSGSFMKHPTVIRTTNRNVALWQAMQARRRMVP